MSVLPINQIVEGDCLEVMAGWPDKCVDAVVTDPPYGLSFMGKEWDTFGRAREYKQRNPGKERINGLLPGYGRGGTNDSVVQYRLKAAHELYDASLAWASEALRMLKPGGHLLAFGGTRTHHRLMCAIEDAGFEIRDCLMWLYGSGFPKSLDVSKAIDKAAGAKRTLRVNERWLAKYPHGPGGNLSGGDGRAATVRQLKHIEQPLLTSDPATPEAQQWQGWGTALKPAYEIVILARKPLSEKNVAANVLKWGTGGLNVDACRIETAPADAAKMERCNSANSARHKVVPAEDGRFGRPSPTGNLDTSQGRWPANVLLDEEAGAMLDEQSGETSTTGKRSRRSQVATVAATAWGTDNHESVEYPADSGGASRFFYCAKASRRERGEGNKHPTVKPLKLMAYLCRLVTPPNGIVLDPFAGSGSTCIAARDEGFKFVGIEKDHDYCEIARKRLREDAPLLATAQRA